MKVKCNLFSGTQRNYFKDVESIFQPFKEYYLKVKLDKTEFFKSKPIYLGQIIH